VSADGHIARVLRERAAALACPDGDTMPADRIAGLLMRELARKIPQAGGIEA
jgi:hypothetical protein